MIFGFTFWQVENNSKRNKSNKLCVVSYQYTFQSSKYLNKASLFLISM